MMLGMLQYVCNGYKMNRHLILEQRSRASMHSLQCKVQFSRRSLPDYRA